MKLRDYADRIVEVLKNKGFVIQRYDAYSTYSVYLKLDYGVCNTIRISDHEGKQYLKYRYNLILGGENNIIEDKYTRYYFNEHNITGLINQILFDRIMKFRKYGKSLYKHFMIKNRDDHKNDKGFWKDAKLVTNDLVEDLQTKKFVSSVTGREEVIKLTQMPNGTYACGPETALNYFKEVIEDDMKLNNSAKFKQDETIKVTASYEELEKYYMNAGETDIQAKTHALQILGKPEYSIGTNLGATKCDEGMFYSLELPLVPIEFLPENFLSKI